MISKNRKNIEIKSLFITITCLISLSGCVQQGPSIKEEAPKPKNLTEKKQEAPKKYKKTNKAFRDLNYDELKISKDRLISEGRKETAVKHIEKMMPLCNDIEELKNLALEISDLYFETGNLQKAEQLYTQFGQSYPGDKNIEYANYKSILCNYWLTLDRQRDQSKTKTAITLAKNFLERSAVFTTYNDEVEKILVDCQNKLLESEVNICKDYINRGDQLSAKTRIANIQKEFLEQMPQIESQLLVLECEYAEIFNDKDLLAKKQEELNTKFPNYKENFDKSILLAKAKKNKTSFVDKF